MYKLVLIRHGESTWNKENRFTGWVDVDLTEKGNREAQQAGVLLKESGYTFDIAYTSVLKRAIRTLWHVQDQMDLMYLPVVHSWRLNERHYGALSGLNKAETAAKFGDEQVLVWRRSYDTPPPALDPSDDRAPYSDPRYAKVPREQLPLTECLKDTVARVLPLWNESIAPAIKSGRKVVIAAHGNSIRAHGEVPRQYFGRRHRRPEYPERRAARLRTRRKPEADQAATIWATRTRLPRRKPLLPSKARRAKTIRWPQPHGAKMQQGCGKQAGPTGKTVGPALARLSRARLGGSHPAVTAHYFTTAAPISRTRSGPCCRITIASAAP